MFGRLEDGLGGLEDDLVWKMKDEVVVVCLNDALPSCFLGVLS